MDGLNNPQGRGRHVHIQEILAGNNNLQEWDFIEVNVVWISSALSAANSMQRREFIFADESAHIAAILVFADDDLDANNVCKKLKVNTHHRISHVAVEENRSYKRLRNQGMRLILRNSTRYVTKNTLLNEKCLPQYFPLQFTRFEDIDDHADKELIDLIGVFCSMSEMKVSKNEIRYKTIQVSSARKESEGFNKIVALFDHHKETLQKKKSRYAEQVLVLMNIEVDTDGDNKTLRTTGSTLIFEIVRDDIPTVLPPEYHLEEFVTKLFPKCRNSPTKPVTSNSCRTAPHCAAEASPPKSTCTLSSSPRPVLININNATVNVGPIDERRFKRSSQGNASQSSTPKDEDAEKTPPRRLELENGVNFLFDHEGENEQESAEDGIYNFIDNMKPLKVKVTPTTKFMDKGKNDYPMRNKPRGHALLIHNTHFPYKPDYPNRKGAVHDVIYLRTFLESCHFTVTVIHNVKSVDFPGALCNFKSYFSPDEANDDEVQALLVAVLSHGSYGSVEMVDGVKVNLYDTFIYPFDETVFPVMKGKPKIFIVQTCQNFQSFETGEQVKHILSQSPQRNTGGLNNMIICFPTSPGSAALRDIYIGSHYIYVLVKVLMKKSHNTDFISILAKVQGELKKVKYLGSEILSCTWTQYSFKKLYFNPGI